MRNLLDLFDQLTDVMLELGIDPREVLDGVPDAEEAATAIRVVGAYQPSYPLTGNLECFSILDHEDGRGDDKIVWLSVGYSPRDMNPYAPNSVFERY